MQEKSPFTGPEDAESELVRLRAKVAEFQGRVGRLSVSAIPADAIPGFPTELSVWMEGRQKDLQAALSTGDHSRVVTWSMMLTKGAERMVEMTRQDILDDEFRSRAAPGRVGSPTIDGRTHSRCLARYGLRGAHPGPVSRVHGVSTMLVTSVRDVEAHSVGLPPTRLDTQWSSSDDEPLLTVDPPPTQPVSGTLPTWVDSPRSQVNMPINVRPRLRLSVPSTIVDALEEDLEASVVSTVPASSRAVRRLVLVGGHAHHVPTSPEVRGPDAAVPVINIADPDSGALSVTATDPDLSRDGVANVEMGGDESEVDDSSGDSVVGDRGCGGRSGGRGGSRHRLGRGDCQPCDTCRVCLLGSCGSGQSVQVESFRDEISAEVLAWCVPFGN